MTRLAIPALLLLTMIWGLAPGLAWAEERELSAAEIEQALAGNTVDGNWKGCASSKPSPPN